MAVELEDVGLSFTVFFKKNHLDIGWNRVSFQGRDSHGILSESVACTCTCGIMNRLEVNCISFFILIYVFIYTSLNVKMNMLAYM